MVDWATWRSLAAADRLPCLANAKKNRRSSQSSTIGLLRFFAFSLAVFGPLPAHSGCVG